MDREWEKFRGGPTVSTQEQIHVSIGKRGLLYMNRNAHRVLGRPAAVYLYFNRAKDSIAVQPTSARLPEAFPVIEKQHGFVINASPFCRHFGIRPDTTEKFVRPDLNNEGVLLLDLSNTIHITATTRKRRK